MRSWTPCSCVVYPATVSPFAATLALSDAIHIPERKRPNAYKLFRPQPVLIATLDSVAASTDASDEACHFVPNSS